MARILPFTGEPSPALVEEVRECLSRGGVVAIPTESFYGLAASISHLQAVTRVARIKHRETTKPLLVLIGDRSQLSMLASAVPPAAEILMKRFWPGPLSLIVPAVSSLPCDVLDVSGPQTTVAVRQPGHAFLLSLLRVVGPVTGTSANRAGKPPAQTPQEVLNYFSQDLDVILDGGTTAGGLPSTLVNVVGKPEIVREGAIPRTDVHAALQCHGFSLH